MNFTETFLFIFILISSSFSAKYAPVINTVFKQSGLSHFRNHIGNITADLPDEQRLFYTLMNGYEKSVRPTRKASDPVVVKLGITLTQIMDIVRKTSCCFFLHSLLLSLLFFSGRTKSNYDDEYLVRSGKMQMKQLIFIVLERCSS